MSWYHTPLKYMTASQLDEAAAWAKQLQRSLKRGRI